MAATKKAPAKTAGAEVGTAKAISVQKHVYAVFDVEITGLTSMIVHRFAEKARKEMLDKHLGRLKSKEREKRDPCAEALQCFHVMPGKEDEHKKAGAAWCKTANAEKPETWPEFKAPAGTYGVPTSALLAAVMRSALGFQGVAMTDVARSQQMLEEFGELRWKRIRMRSDVVRVSGGAPDLRYRPEFFDWSAKFRIRLNESLLTIDKWASLAEAAGYSNGIGEWRPEKKAGNPGAHGQFEVTNYTLFRRTSGAPK